MALAQSEQRRFTSHAGNGSSAARTLQEALQLPRKELWWKRYFKWENNLTVAGRTLEKGFVVTPFVAGLITTVVGVSLAAILAVAGYMYTNMNARIQAKDEAYQQQRDMLIEIKTELKIAKEHDAEWKRKQVDDQQIQDLKIQDLKDKILVLKR